jgi:phosphoglycerate kinase
MAKKTIQDIDVRGKRVLVRVDFNVPMEDGRISDDNRIRAALPTINYLRERDARVILCSHLGRPNGKVDESARLAPIAEGLEAVLEAPVAHITDCIGIEVEANAAAMEPGEVLLLENLRFDPGEEANDTDFSEGLSTLADVFVNDAFGLITHRAAGVLHLRVQNRRQPQAHRFDAHLRNDVPLRATQMRAQDHLRVLFLQQI